MQLTLITQMFNQKLLISRFPTGVVEENKAFYFMLGREEYSRTDEDGEYGYESYTREATWGIRSGSFSPIWDKSGIFHRIRNKN